MFTFLDVNTIEVSLDMAVNLQEPGVYFVTINLVTQNNLSERMIVVDKISQQSSTCAIEFTLDYTELTVEGDND